MKQRSAERAGLHLQTDNLKLFFSYNLVLVELKIEEGCYYWIPPPQIKLDKIGADIR